MRTGSITMLQACLLLLCSRWDLCAAFQSSFLGGRLAGVALKHYNNAAVLTMRKQKASDKRTRRRQRGQEEQPLVIPETFTTSPMQVATANTPQRYSSITPLVEDDFVAKGGRGRSRKRSTLYKTIALYRHKFLTLLTDEYKAEEKEILSRIETDDPLGLETAGYALLDLVPMRRGNLFTDEVYRLTKGPDCTTGKPDELPAQHRFRKNDVVVLTLQNSSGDFFECSPINEACKTVEARVLNVSPTHLDISVLAGMFEAQLGSPAPNDISGQGNASMRLRLDRFFSKVPYDRMVSALSQVTTLPRREGEREGPPRPPHESIAIDEVLREVVLSTHAFWDPESPFSKDPSVCNLDELSSRLSTAPMPTSAKLAKEVLAFMRKTSPFDRLNAPQQTAVEAALTRRLTMIQGPPGTGKTTVAAAISYGFVHQCRSLSPHTKVLACAFSNVGADNLAQAIQNTGLKVLRIGKASATAEALWNCTLDAAIERDPDAKKALQEAARATAQLAKPSGRSAKNTPGMMNGDSIRDAATRAVKLAQEATLIAATKALRETDVIVSTSTGAADLKLLAACGMIPNDDDVNAGKASTTEDRGSNIATRTFAPDGGPPLSLPFVLIDEACQSVEPATLVPVMASNSCRSLVLLGDPCQLPPTVLGDPGSRLSVSLMERLAEILPSSRHSSKDVDLEASSDDEFLTSLPAKQATSLLRSFAGYESASYRRRYSGSLLLSVQYRMHPSIAAFSSAIFYDGLLKTPRLMSSHRQFPTVLREMMPCGDRRLCFRFIDVGGRANERRGIPTRISDSEFNGVSSSLVDQTSYWNELEADRTLQLLKDVVRAQDKHVSSIGIISPYSGQVQLVQSMIESDIELQDLLKQEHAPSIEINSVDGYQGRERDLIIFSAVRSNRENRIGFLRDWRRLNVALTRAKSGLVIVGDLSTLSGSDPYWAALGKWAKGHRAVVDDYDSPEDEPSV